MGLLTFRDREAVAIGFLDLLSHKERYTIRRTSGTARSIGNVRYSSINKAKLVFMAKFTPLERREDL